MELCQLVYVSRATAHTDMIEIADLASESSIRNAQQGVTGVLFCCNGFFIQAIEGEQQVIRRLIATIGRDPRHCDLHVISNRAIRYREYGNWGMALLDTHAEGATRSSFEQLSNAVFAAMRSAPETLEPDRRAILKAVDRALLHVETATPSPAQQ